MVQKRNVERYEHLKVSLISKYDELWRLCSFRHNEIFFEILGGQEIFPDLFGGPAIFFQNSRGPRLFFSFQEILKPSTPELYIFAGPLWASEKISSFYSCFLLHYCRRFVPLSSILRSCRVAPSRAHYATLRFLNGFMFFEPSLAIQ